jgi:tryptophan 2,3-dioxygenase
MTSGPPPPLPPRDPSRDVTHNHYWRYHDLEQLLACKAPVTASQDEDLFIAVHQICELAFHQMILDLDRTLDAFEQSLDAGAPSGPTGEACYFLARVVKLYDVACRTVPVLMTMRAFSEFRPRLGPSSGFQSYQFRRLEIMSGVEWPYWTGGTADAQGKLHPAEVAFDERFGDDVAEWFERYRQRSLRAAFERLVARAPGDDRAAKIAALRNHPAAAPLLEQLRAYEEAQLTFHRVHRNLAIQQLEIVGVDYGTGGTSFRDYLTRYEREAQPLFPGLASR